MTQTRITPTQRRALVAGAGSDGFIRTTSTILAVNLVTAGLAEWREVTPWIGLPAMTLAGYRAAGALDAIHAEALAEDAAV